MFVSGHHKDWDEYLPYVIYAYQRSINPSTNEMLVFLNYGYDAKQPSFLDALVISLKNAETLKNIKVI